MELRLLSKMAAMQGSQRQLASSKPAKLCLYYFAGSMWNSLQHLQCSTSRDLRVPCMTLASCLSCKSGSLSKMHFGGYCAASPPLRPAETAMARLAIGLCMRAPESCCSTVRA